MKIDKQKMIQAFSLFMLLIRLCIGCMFLWSSLPKIRYPYDFLSSVYSYELVGPKLGMFVAMTIPWLEVLVGICLVGGIFVSGSLLASAGLGAMFTFVLGSAIYHNLDITCGCFGASSTELIDASTLVRAVLIVLFSMLAYSWIIFKPVKDVLLNAKMDTGREDLRLSPCAGQKHR